MMGPFGAIMDGFPGDSEDLGGGVGVLQDGVESVVDQLNSLGLEGWELVGFTHNYGERGATFVFKRPKG
jgi:hypothetical protein